MEKKLTACLLVTHESGTLTGLVKHRKGVEETAYDGSNLRRVKSEFHVPIDT